MTFSRRNLPPARLEFPEDSHARSLTTCVPDSGAPRPYGLRRFSLGRQSGLTLVELIVAITILLILTSAAIPIARVRIRREKERELRRVLWEVRDAIDRYKDAADRGAFQIKLGSEGYPPDLDRLVEGEDVAGKKVRFLRRIPEDPMTGGTDWGKRCMSDDPKSTSWCGDNIFDIFTKTQGTSLDGTKYSEW